MKKKHTHRFGLIIIGFKSWVFGLVAKLGFALQGIVFFFRFILVMCVRVVMCPKGLVITGNYHKNALVIKKKFIIEFN